MHSEPSTRRSFLKYSGISLLGAGLADVASNIDNPSSNPSAFAAEPVNPSVSSIQALRQLQEGNLRFREGRATWPHQTSARRIAVAQKQQPVAMIFSCVDSRVPPELVFDQGLGDLFVIRTAAHVIDNAALGSLEFGAAELHIPLLVVLGHKRCGAVSATIKAIATHEEAPGSIKTLVDYIRPAVVGATGTGATLLNHAVLLNTKRTVHALHTSAILNDAVKSGKLAIVGAYYDLDKGAVSIIKN